MLKLLTKREAIDWFNENTENKDVYFAPLAECVQEGRLIQINRNWFVVCHVEHGEQKWVIDKVWETTPEERKKENLCCKYRYAAHIEKKAAGYCGPDTICIGFDLPE